MVSPSSSAAAPLGAAPHEVGLDERLVEVTLRLLAEEGLERLSLRRIARRAGVSHNAPLRHFESLADLLAEVAASGFRLLAGAVDEASRALPPGTPPDERLRAAGRAYAEKAVANPDLFALMFRPELLDARNASMRRDASEAFEQVVSLVRAAQAAGWQPDRDTRLLAGCTWASVHGLATLFAQGALPGAVPGASLEDAMEVLFELQIAAPVSSGAEPAPDIQEGTS